jgi:hypothetical protein
MEGINQVKTSLEKKHKLFDSVAFHILRSDKFVRQHLDTNASHIVFEDKFNNKYGLRLIQDSNSKNYEVALAISSGGQHVGVSKIKTRKEFIELIAHIEFKMLIALKAVEHANKQ